MRAISTILSGMVFITLSTIAQEREPTTYFGPLLSAGAAIDWSSPQDLGEAPRARHSA